MKANYGHFPSSFEGQISS